MKIKEEKEFKFPQIMFNTIWANIMFMVVLGFWFVNIVLSLVGYSHLPLVALGLITFGAVAFYLLMLGGPGEAFASNAPQKNFNDFKRTVVYTVLSFIVFVVLYNINKVEPKPQIIVQEKTIKITDLVIFDKHRKKIIYGIGFKDNEGNIRWESQFIEVKDRDDYLNTLVKDNKFKVQIFFKIDKHNNGSLEIIKQNIKDT